jgi:ribosome-binding protein aMBF1 (putative translation factor)
MSGKEARTMAFTDDVFPPDDLCEICGARLDDEIVIQEFADGSLARLCGECAAGATLGTEQPLGHDPLEPSRESQAPADADPLERTRELLTPVVDLIGLQREMQGALERLAASLETFAAGVLTDSRDKTATVEDRVQGLERELEQTRARLREAEALLGAAATTSSGDTAPPEGTGGVAAEAAFVSTVAEVSSAAERPQPSGSAPVFEAASTAGASAPAGAGVAAEAAQAGDMGEAGGEVEAGPATEAGGEVEAGADIEASPNVGVAWPSDEAPTESPPMFGAIEEPPPVVPVSATSEAESRPEGAPSAWPAGAEPAESAGEAAPSIPSSPVEGARHVFRIEEVQAAQRYFNESPFTGKTRDVQGSLGRPRANLTRAAGSEARAFVTVYWDIVWYQYMVDMRADIPGDQRVVLHREGMDLDELAPQFKEKNATIDDSGRLDASELEIKLLSDPTTLITEMTPDEERALEDATEEIWDQRIAPEFKWDD